MQHDAPPGEDALPATDSASSTSHFSRRNVLIGGALTVASGFAYARQPHIGNPVVDVEKFESWVPSRFGEWTLVSESGVVLPPPDSLSDRLYDNLLTRVFTAPNKPAVMLLLAYNNAQDGVLQVHRPEVCYPVGGYDLTPTRKIDLQAGGVTVPANIFTASSPKRTEQVAYFTRLGAVFPRSWAEQRLAVMRANLAGDIPDGMMMRVSLMGLNQMDAEKQLNGFTNDFIGAVDPNLRRLLLGRNT